MSSLFQTAQYHPASQAQIAVDAMTVDWEQLIIAAALTLALTTVVALVIRKPLHGVLLVVCGTEVSARFWTTFSSVLLVMGPLFLVFTAAGGATNLADFVRRTVYLVSFGVIAAFLVMWRSGDVERPRSSPGPASGSGSFGRHRRSRSPALGTQPVTTVARAYLLLSATILLAMSTLVGWIDWPLVGQVAVGAVVVFCFLAFLLIIYAIVIGVPVLLTIVVGYGLARLFSGRGGPGDGPGRYKAGA